MRTKLLAWVLILSIALSFTACGNQENKSSLSEQKSSVVSSVSENTSSTEDSSSTAESLDTTPKEPSLVGKWQATTYGTTMEFNFSIDGKISASMQLEDETKKIVTGTYSISSDDSLEMNMVGYDNPLVEETSTFKKIPFSNIEKICDEISDNEYSFNSTYFVLGSGYDYLLFTRID